MFYFYLGKKKEKLMQVWKRLSIEELLLCETSLFSLEVEKFLCAPSLIRANYQLAITIDPETINQKSLCN